MPTRWIKGLNMINLALVKFNGFDKMLGEIWSLIKHSSGIVEVGVLNSVLVKSDQNIRGNLVTFETNIWQSFSLVKASGRVRVLDERT